MQLIHSIYTDAWVPNLDPKPKKHVEGALLSIFNTELGALRRSLTISTNPMPSRPYCDMGPHRSFAARISHVYC